MSQEAVALRPISTAPKTGAVVEILAATNDRAGCGGWLIVHYADGGGEDQPRFRGWFYWTGHCFSQIDESKLIGWVPLPSIPQAGQLMTPGEQRIVVCRSCGRRDGTHDDDCRVAERLAKQALQAECDHRLEYGTTRTTGDPPGPPRCGRCGTLRSRALGGE